MSLTTALAKKEVRSALKPLVHKPRMKALPCFVPWETKNASRVGTAFDYALRFGLAARGWARVTKTVALGGVRKLVDVQPDLQEAARERFEAAIGRLTSLEAGDELGTKAAAACYRLGGLDIVFRAQRADQVLQEPTDDEVAELQGLHGIVPWSDFEPDRRLLLNPTFGEGSRAIGGADADLILDDCLIDVKTVKRNVLKLKMVRQLVGYVALARRYGINEGSPEPLSEMGVYFARSGELVRFPVAEVCSEEELDEVERVLFPWEYGS